jgi:hypothetical protein
MAHEKVLKNGLKLPTNLADGTGDEILTISSTGIIKKIASIGTPLSSTLADGRIFIGNASNVATGVATSGDITLSNTGVFAIATGVIVNADVNASAAIAYSKLNLTSGIVNADVNASAAIAYSKLNLTGNIVNADINAAAAIARTKFANGTANRVVINNASGVMTDNSAITANRAIISDANGLPTQALTTATEIGYVNGVTSSIQTQLETTIVGQNTSATLQSPGAGQDGFIISWDNGNNRFNLTSVTASGVPNGGTTNQILRKINNVDQNTEWHTLVFGDLTDVSGTTVTEINLLNGMTVGSTELNMLTGIGANVQTQLDGKLSNSLTTDNIWVGVGGVATPGTNLPTGTTIGGAVIYRVGGTDVAVADGGTGIGSYTAGDILTATGATTLTKLALGSALQVLRVNAGGTALEYAAPAGGVTGLTTNRIPYATSSTTLGDGPTWDSTNQALTIFQMRLHSRGGATNAFIGGSAGNFTSTGTQNVGIGNQALFVLTSGTDNVAVGYLALGQNTSGAGNIGIGSSALAAMQTGQANIGIGPSALLANTAGLSNIALGSAALSLCTGDRNIAFGENTGNNITSGSRNVIIGYNVDAQSATASDQLVIQNIIFGLSNSGSGTTPSTGFIGIGEPAPTRKLEVAGSHAIKAGTSTGQIARVGGVLHTNITTAGNVGTGEDTLFTYTIPANVLATDKDAIVATFTITLAATANDKRLRVKFGSTTIVDNTDASTNSGTIVVMLEIIRTGSNTQKCSAYIIPSTNTGNPSYYATASETLSGTVALVVTGEATSNNDIVFQMGKVRWEPAE